MDSPARATTRTSTNRIADDLPAFGRVVGVLQTHNRISTDDARRLRDAAEQLVRAELPRRNQTAQISKPLVESKQAPTPRRRIESATIPTAELVAPASSQKPSLARVTADFLADHNIRWGEIVAGILIVTCSIGLVISLWNTLTALHRVVPTIIFITADAAVFAAGLYTMRRWKIRHTSRSILIIATLLVPLCVLAGLSAAGIHTDAAMDATVSLTDPLTIVTIVAGALGCSSLLFSSGCHLVGRPDAPRLTAIVVAPTVMLPLLPALVRSFGASATWLTGIAMFCSGMSLLWHQRRSLRQTRQSTSRPEKYHAREYFANQRLIHLIAAASASALMGFAAVLVHDAGANTWMGLAIASVPFWVAVAIGNLCDARARISPSETSSLDASRWIAMTVGVSVCVGLALLWLPALTRIDWTWMLGGMLAICLTLAAFWLRRYQHLPAALIGPIGLAATVTSPFWWDGLAWNETACWRSFVGEAPLIVSAVIAIAFALGFRLTRSRINATLAIAFGGWSVTQAAIVLVSSTCVLSVFGLLGDDTAFGGFSETAALIVMGIAVVVSLSTTPWNAKASWMIPAGLTFMGLSIFDVSTPLDSISRQSFSPNIIVMLQTALLAASGAITAVWCLRFQGVLPSWQHFGSNNQTRLGIGLLKTSSLVLACGVTVIVTAWNGIALVVNDVAPLPWSHASVWLAIATIIAAAIHTRWRDVAGDPHVWIIGWLTMLASAMGCLLAQSWIDVDGSGQIIALTTIALGISICVRNQPAANRMRFGSLGLTLIFSFVLLTKHWWAAIVLGESPTTLVTLIIACWWCVAAWMISNEARVNLNHKDQQASFRVLSAILVAASSAVLAPAWLSTHPLVLWQATMLGCLVHAIMVVAKTTRAHQRGDIDNGILTRITEHSGLRFDCGWTSVVIIVIGIGAIWQVIIGDTNWPWTMPLGVFGIAVPWVAFAAGWLTCHGHLKWTHRWTTIASFAAGCRLQDRSLLAKLADLLPWCLLLSSGHIAAFASNLISVDPTVVLAASWLLTLTVAWFRVFANGQTGCRELAIALGVALPVFAIISSGGLAVAADASWCWIAFLSMVLTGIGTIRPGPLRRIGQLVVLSLGSLVLAWIGQRFQLSGIVSTSIWLTIWAISWGVTGVFVPERRQLIAAWDRLADREAITMAGIGWLTTITLQRVDAEWIGFGATLACLAVATVVWSLPHLSKASRNIKTLRCTGDRRSRLIQLILRLVCWLTALNLMQAIVWTSLAWQEPSQSRVPVIWNLSIIGFLAITMFWLGSWPAYKPSIVRSVRWIGVHIALITIAGFALLLHSGPLFWLPAVMRLLIASILVAATMLAMVWRTADSTLIQQWRLSLYRGGITASVTAIGCLLTMLCLELIMREENGLPDVPSTLVVVVAIMLGVMAALSAIFAIWTGPNRKIEASHWLTQFQWSDSRRRLLVHTSQAVAMLAWGHTALCRPELASLGLKTLWPYLVLVIAFVSVGITQWAIRRGDQAIADAMRRTSLFLPLIPVIGFWISGMSWMGNSPIGVQEWRFGGDGVGYAPVLLSASLAYGLMAWRWRQRLPLIATVVLANAALWIGLAQTPGWGFLIHPQAWLIPPAVCGLVIAHWHRHRMNADLLSGIRYGSTLVIYLASTADMLLSEIGRTLWGPVVLILLALIGMAAGAALRIRPFLVLGVAFVFLGTVSMIWHAGRAIDAVWPWWAFGITTGLLLMTGLALIERHKTALTGAISFWKRLS